ncbi:NAD-P-binding protein [Russula earlei]|uniref:NAD-P-binding protein n=1 Tax=Russula earlei TaxID=71964 RepID=A0ACC0UBZ2_9AGAM|nr:NAD-P-binding protein [Russula earlei]
MAELKPGGPLSSAGLRLVQELPYSRPATPGYHTQVRVGWIGLGAMGYLMARNLANHRATHVEPHRPLLVWNRTRQKGEKLLHELGGGKVAIAQAVVDVATTCDIVFTSLSSDDVIRSVYEEIAAAFQAQPPATRKILVDTSTIYPRLAGEIDALVSAIPHCSFVTAPIFGPPAMAENATLIIALSGDYRSKKEVAFTVVPAIGRRVIDLGGNIEKAPTFKLIGNSLILGSLELIAEAYTMAEKSGIGQDVVYTYIKEMFPAPLWLSYGDKMLHDKFDGTEGFSIDGGVKDATHIRRLSSELNSPMPAIDTAHHHLLTARALHAAQERTGTTSFPVLDWSALIAGTRVAAGLDAFESGKQSGPVPESESE